MAKGIGNLGQIVQDFKESVNQIVGNSSGKRPSDAIKGGTDKELFKPEYGGVKPLGKEEKKKWLGNTKNPNAVRYWFAILSSEGVQTTNFLNPNNKIVIARYFLDIPPQSISQKEIFATSISATRKGVIVESEGVVFKDIILAGTTGIFPGLRGGANNAIPDFKNFTDPPKEPQGVDADTGLSTKSGVSTLSGYEEFIRLRQFFLRFAAEKVKENGDRFMIFANEKDNQYLIVEPLEFTMERNSKSPLTYNYKIVLKSIGSFDGGFMKGLTPRSPPKDILEKIGNVAANVSATISTGRAVFAQSIRMLQRIEQAIDQTFIGPLRQVQYASQDLSEGVATVLSLPAILLNNATTAVLNTRDALDTTANTIGAFVQDPVGSVTGPASRSASSSNERREARKRSGEEFVFSRDTIDKITNDPRIPMPRSFVSNLKAKTDSLHNNIADSVALGNPVYNAIYNRTVTNPAPALKVPTDDEFILLGSLKSISSSLNGYMATNLAFTAEADVYYQNAAAAFQGLLNLPTPTSVREITIERNDTLERIAQRELGDATRWVELVVLNKLKAPYISAALGDGVKKFGDKLLIGIL